MSDGWLSIKCHKTEVKFFMTTNLKKVKIKKSQLELTMNTC